MKARFCLRQDISSGLMRTTEHRRALKRIVDRLSGRFVPNSQCPELALSGSAYRAGESLLSECAFNRSVQHRLQSIGWRLEAQGLSRTLIEPQSNRVQITLRDAREIGSSREVLPQQAVGVLV